MQYSLKYGDPNWLWMPTACAESHAPGAAFTFPSVASETIRAVDITELRARIDGLRRRFALPPYTWTDGQIRSGKTPVRAVHLHELRSALNEAYSAARRATPTYTDATLVSGRTPIKSVHIVELRAAVVALEAQE